MSKLDFYLLKKNMDESFVLFNNWESQFDEKFNMIEQVDCFLGSVMIRTRINGT